MIRIAITEDLPIVLEGIKLLLSQVKDFDVVAEYKNGKELVDHIHETDADIILTDIDMPVMDGITATKQITSKYPGKKVIALSMYSDSVYYYNLITSGAKGFVLKQSSVSDLEKAVRDVFMGGSFFSNDLLQNIIIRIHKDAGKTGQKKDSNNISLTPREKNFMGLLCQGLTNKDLAEKLFVSIKTVESYKAKLMDKTGARNTAGLIIWAIKNKIVDL